MLLSGLMGLLAGACSSTSAPSERDIGVARIALAVVPADVQCLEVSASAARSVTKRATLVPGTSVTLDMTGLPLGAVQFSANAFAEDCASSTSSSPTWISDPVSATIIGGVVAEVELTMHHNGRASVRIDFADDDGGVDGGGGQGGSPQSDGQAGTGGQANAGGGAGGVGGAQAGGIDGGMGGGGADAGGGVSCAAGSALDVWTKGGAPEDIRGLFAIAPNDAWMTTDQHVRRWDGATWTTVSFDLGPSDSLGAVWASGPDDVWVSGTRLMRWNGTVWTDMAVPVTYVATLPKVSGRGPNDVWVWTDRQISHWDGTSWSDRPPLLDPPTGWIFVQVLWPASADDVWLAGYGQAGTLLEHWNGASWQLWPLSTNIKSFTGMWGSSPTDIWLLGDRGMMHYDGISWTLANATLRGQGDIWGSCASDVWAALAPVAPTYSPRVAHFDGEKWSTITLVAGQSGSLVSGTGPDDVWVATSYLPTIYHRHPGDPASVCGNVRLDPGEQCDPPDGRTCNSICQLVPGCGDGVLGPGESCDPPDGLTCDQNCQPMAVCGNGFIDPGEDCDPPRSGPGLIAPWCDATCHIPRCGNGVVDPGESCDPPVQGWSPGHGSSYYCGPSCTLVDACVECALDPSSPSCQVLLGEHGCGT